MRDYLLFVDTETSGKPPSQNTPELDAADWPYILQLAWSIYTSDGELVKAENHYIRNETVRIDKDALKVHGITKAQLRDQGEERKAILRRFSRDLRQYKPLIIGHYVEFDLKMLQLAIYRSGIKNIVKDYPYFCTMRATTEYVQFPGHEYPKLDELHQTLFRERMLRQHDAAADAEATARCFFELYRRGDLEGKLNEEKRLFARVKARARRKYGCTKTVLLALTFILFTCLVL